VRRSQPNADDALVLHHLVEGSGPVVVLLHAGVADLRMWAPQVAPLGRTHSVVRCDFRGFGGSRLETGASYSDAEDVLALLDHLDIARFSLVGASFGGHVALQVASAVPERVDALVLLAPAADLVEPDERLRVSWTDEERLVEAGDIEAAVELDVRSWVGPEADDEARDLVRHMQRHALVQQVAAGEVDARELPVLPDRITMPTTIVVGALDFDFFRDTARQLAVLLPRGRLVELAWAGHLPSLERPDETTRVVTDALSSR
jgi:pimeloyl-ACP methyl ester carboxylesterase